jgi:hypothetical protein
MRHSAVLLIGLTLAAGVAAAAPTKQELQEADRRFQKGNKLYQEGRYQEALHVYLAAYDLAPVPEILFNIGLAREKILDYEECALAFGKYLAEQPDGALAARAKERLEVCRGRAKIPVKVSSIPPGAAITLADEQSSAFRGRTPAEFALAPGTYTISVELPGYIQVSQRVAVDVGNRPEVDFPLEKLAVLRVEADIEGAMVQIDDTPAEPAPFRRELRAGTYRVRVTRDGHREVVRQVALEPGQESTLVLSLPALPVSRTLRVEANVPARVRIDGHPRGSVPAEVSSMGGVYRVEVDAPGRIPYAGDIRLPEDRDVRVDVRLSATRSRRQKAVLWSLLGTAGVAAAAGTAYAVLAAQDQAAYDDMPSLDLADRGESRAFTADVLFGASLALAATTVVYWLVTRPERSHAEIR